MYGVIAAVRVQLTVHELAAAVAVQAKHQSMWEAGMVIVDLRQEGLDGLRRLRLRPQKCRVHQ